MTPKQRARLPVDPMKREHNHVPEAWRKDCPACSFDRGAEVVTLASLADERSRLWQARALDAEARLAVAVEALSWYASSENYMHRIERNKRGEPEVCEATWRPVILDAGQRARDALQKLRAAKEGR